MTMDSFFLIIDGYPKESRDKLEAAGMHAAWKLYANMLTHHLPQAKYDVWFASDTAELPHKNSISAYRAVLWTGCNLTIFHDHDERVQRQIQLAKQAFQAGVTSFGSCWALQIATVAAGGKVEVHPRGREMGLARKISLTPAGLKHPMYTGKNAVFDAFISHEDQVTVLPENSTCLAGNSFTHIQAAAITHNNTSFWATQYHPEYDLKEMARLIIARTEKLIKGGFYHNTEETIGHVSQLEKLHTNPKDYSLQWQLAIDDDVLDQEYRQLEFKNWLDHEVLSPSS